MTTKYITTYIAGGYLIASGVNEVIVTHTGGVGRTEIVGGEGYKTVVNEGLINNTYRGFGGRYAGIYLQTGGRVTNGSAAYPGSTSLDLADIGFVSSTEATYSGTKTGGVLTVTDGTHTARINLKGNYLGSTFVAASDGHGGTDVVDPKAKAGVGPAQMGSAHVFIAAMAGVGGSAAHAPVHAGAAWPARETTLANPSVAAA